MSVTISWSHEFQVMQRAPSKKELGSKNMEKDPLERKPGCLEACAQGKVSVGAAVQSSGSE